MNLIMAHRGWSSLAPENTLAAIQLAVKENWINSIELDVQLTKDQVPVVTHDFRLERTTNGAGFVKDLTLEQIRQFDAGSWFAPQFEGEKIPTLEEVLQLCKAQKRLNLELKTAGNLYPSLSDKVVRLVTDMQMEKEVIITSFDHERVKRVRELTTEIETGLIIEGNPALLHEQLEYTGASVISMAFWYLTKPFVEKHLEAGRKIVVWTPNSEEEINFVKGISPHIEICTNYPERV